MISKEEKSRERGKEEGGRNVYERKNGEEMKGRGRREKERKGRKEGRKDNAPTIKLSRLTPRIKRPQRTLGSVTKLLEYFAPLKRGRIEGG